MVSNTSHYNLVKPAYDESADVAVINGNMDTIDGQMYKNEQGVNNLQNGLAIVANGNTHVAITSGQYVFVKNHGTLADGLYVATSNIAANATLSSSNLTADTAGGLNALNNKLTTNTVSSFFTIDSTKITLDATSNCYKTGNVVCAVFDFTVKSGVSGIQTIGTINESIRPRKNIYGTFCDYATKTTAISFVLTEDGSVKAYGLTEGHEYLGTVCYLI